MQPYIGRRLKIEVNEGEIIKNGTENLAEDKEIEANQYEGESGKTQLFGAVFSYLNKLIHLSKTLASMFPKLSFGTEVEAIRSTIP